MRPVRRKTRPASVLQRGFTLVELVIFIVVTGILAAGLMAAFSAALSGTGTVTAITVAMQLAQERLELILAGKRLQASYDPAAFDPCAGGTPPPQCTAPAGYVVTPVIAASAFGAEYNEITVTVSGAGDASVQALVADY